MIKLEYRYSMDPDLYTRTKTFETRKDMNQFVASHVCPRGGKVVIVAVTSEGKAAANRLNSLFGLK